MSQVKYKIIQFFKKALYCLGTRRCFQNINTQNLVDLTTSWCKRYLVEFPQHIHFYTFTVGSITINQGRMAAHIWRSRTNSVFLFAAVHGLVLRSNIEHFNFGLPMSKLLNSRQLIKQQWDWFLKNSTTLMSKGHLLRFSQQRQSLKQAVAVVSCQHQLFLFCLSSLGLIC